MCRVGVASLLLFCARPRGSVRTEDLWGSGPAGRHVSFPVHTVGQEQNPDHSHSPCAVGSHSC